MEEGQIKHVEIDIGPHKHIPGIRNRDAWDKAWGRYYCALCDKRLTIPEVQAHRMARLVQYIAIIGLTLLLVFLWKSYLPF